MARLLAICLALAVIGVVQTNSAYADSDKDKYEHKYNKDKRDKRYNDDKNQGAVKYQQQATGYQNKPATRDAPATDPVSKGLDAVSHGANKVAHQAKQAKSWWQFW